MVLQWNDYFKYVGSYIWRPKCGSTDTTVHLFICKSIVSKFKLSYTIVTKVRYIYF